MGWQQLLVVLGCLSTTIQSEWMTWNFNTTVNPCDNFYSFICPHNMTGSRAKREAPKSTEAIIKEMETELRKLCNGTNDKIAESYCPVCENTTNCESFEHKARLLTRIYITRKVDVEVALKSSLRETIEWWNVTVPEFEAHHNQTLSGVIENAIAISKNVSIEVEKMIMKTSWRNEAPDPNPDFPNAPTIGEQHLILLNNTANMWGSWTGNDLKQRLNTVKKVLELVDNDMENLNVTGPLAELMEMDRFNSYVNLFNSVLGFWEDSNDLELDLLRIKMMKHNNAFNTLNLIKGKPIIAVMEQRLLLTADTALVPAWFANVAMTYGHESFHTFFDSGEQARATPVKKINETISCVEKKAMEACKEENFGQEICMSGPITWSEDVADLEGFRAAYKAYETAFEPLLDQQVTTADERSLEFTFEQLYFIAISKFNCGTYGYHDHHRGRDGAFDTHSTIIIRNNLVFSQMEEFGKAFNCKAGDKMVQNDVCRAFGDEL